MNRYIIALLLILFSGLSNFVAAVTMEDLLPKREKTGDWIIEKLNHPDYSVGKAPVMKEIVNIGIEASNHTESIWVECLPDDRYASVAFYLNSLGLSDLQMRQVDVRVNIDGKDIVHFTNKKSVSNAIYISDYDMPYTNKILELFKQMSKGNTIMFEVSGNRQGISNLISLKGFTRAYNVMSQSCRGK